MNNPLNQPATWQDPWRTFGRLQSEMNRLFDRHLDRDDDATPAAADWRPAVDVREEEDRYVIHVDVPGVSPEDVEITAENGTLRLRGERRSEVTEAREQYQRVERLFGRFQRQFTLPEAANTDAIEATCKNGVLEVVIPKQERVQPRRIPVSH